MKTYEEMVDRAEAEILLGESGDTSANAELLVDYNTQYGFTWGNVEVTRLAHFEGRGRTLGVRVAGKAQADGLQIYVSDGGRSVRVWKAGRELT